MLRNRKTGVEMSVSPAGSLAKLSRNSVFHQEKEQIATSVPGEEFVLELLGKLPAGTTEKKKDQIRIRLLQEFDRQNKEISVLLNSPDAVGKLEAVLRAQMQAKAEPESPSISGFLQVLGSAVVSAQLNSLFPGLGLLTMIAPAAATSTYNYFQGPPPGGKDMCEGVLVDCIQGYMAELGKVWNGTDMPQVSRVFAADSNLTQPCVSQQDLQAMMVRTYRGPNPDIAGCTLEQAINSGSNVTVTATNVDPVTCNLMRDSLWGLADQCSKQPAQPGAPSNALYYGLGIGLGVPALIILCCILRCCIKKCHESHERKHLLHTYA